MAGVGRGGRTRRQRRRALPAAACPRPPQPPQLARCTAVVLAVVQGSAGWGPGPASPGQVHSGGAPRGAWPSLTWPGTQRWCTPRGLAQPHLARYMAVVHPAGPAPTTMACCATAFGLQPRRGRWHGFCASPRILQSCARATQGVRAAQGSAGALGGPPHRPDVCVAGGCGRGAWARGGRRGRLLAVAALCIADLEAAGGQQAGAGRATLAQSGGGWRLRLRPRG